MNKELETISTSMAAESALARQDSMLHSLLGTVERKRRHNRIVRNGATVAIICLLLLFVSPLSQQTEDSLKSSIYTEIASEGFWDTIDTKSNSFVAIENRNTDWENISNQGLARVTIIDDRALMDLFPGRPIMLAAMENGKGKRLIFLDELDENLAD